MIDIQLRPTTIDDLPFVLTAERHKDNRDFVDLWTYGQHTSALADSNLMHLLIERAEDHKTVGYIILAGVTNVHQSIELRRIVVTEKGHGYGKTALRMVKQLAFKQLNAHRLWLDVRAHNTRARQIYEAEGFVVEGILRESYKPGEHFESLAVMSILVSEYQEA